MERIGLVLVILAFFVVLSYLPPFRNYRRWPAPLDPGRPYQVYCRDFDMEVEAGKLDAVLAVAPALDRNWAERYPDIEKEFAARRASRKPPCPNPSRPNPSRRPKPPPASGPRPARTCWTIRSCRC